MTLGMLKNVLSPMSKELMFDEASNIEIINKNTGAHYHKYYDNGEPHMTLGGDAIDASEDWVLGLPVTNISVYRNNLIICVDG